MDYRKEVETLDTIKTYFDLWVEMLSWEVLGQHIFTNPEKAAHIRQRIYLITKMAQEEEICQK